MLVALWKKPPLHVPFYDDSIFSYLNFMHNSVIITNKKYNKNEELMKINEKDETKIVIINNNIITRDFFENIIDKSNSNQFYVFSSIFNYIFKNLSCKSDTFIIDEVSNISKYENCINCSDYKIKKQSNCNNLYTNYIITKDSINSIYPSLLKCDLKTWIISSSNRIDEQNAHTNCLINECILAKINAPAYILNHSKNHFNLIEKYVYDIANFHLNRMNIKFDENIFIEFWFKSRNVYGSTIHTDSDDYAINKKNISKKPFLSCLTYLDNNNDPTIITNIDNNAYKFKKLNDNTLCFSFPVKMKHIVFNGGKYYHCEGNVFDNNIQDERCILIVDFWYNHMPMNLEYYDSKKHVVYNEIYNNYTTHENFKRDDSILHFNNENQNIKKIGLTDDILNSNIFEEIFYKKDMQVFKKFKNIFNGEDLYNNNTIILYKNVKNSNNNKPVVLNSMKFNSELFNNMQSMSPSPPQHCQEVSVLPNELQRCKNNNNNNNNNIEETKINDASMRDTVLNVSHPTKLNDSLNLKRHIIADFLENNICNWIKQSVNEYIYKNNEWFNYNINNTIISIINIDKLPNILNYIINNVFDLISKSINEKFLFVKEKILNFKDIFITKYDDSSNSFNFYNSNNCITCYIFLNNTNLFMGSMKNLEKDDEICIMKQGNMIMHISDSNYNMIKHIDGSGYFLVFYIELYDR
jgi:hypothetical protein